MDVQRFTDLDKPQKPMRIVSYPPAVCVRMLGDPADCLKLWLHWRGKHSYPCLGENCIDCREDRFPYGYCPVQVGVINGRAFLTRGLGILPVTPEGLDLCLLPLKGQVLEVTRFPATRRGATNWKQLDHESPCYAKPFDVLPHLEKVWEWFLKKDRASNMAQSIAEMSSTEAYAIAGKIGRPA